jgi:hypothetical protein
MVANGILPSSELSISYGVLCSNNASTGSTDISRATVVDENAIDIDNNDDDYQDDSRYEDSGENGSVPGPTDGSKVGVKNSSSRDPNELSIDLGD